MTSAEQLEILALTHALIDAGWTQFSYQRGERYCLLGAVESVAWGLAEPDQQGVAVMQLAATTQLLVRAMRQLPYRPEEHDRSILAHWNDAPTRRKRDVLRLIERAAAKVGKG